MRQMKLLTASSAAISVAFVGMYAMFERFSGFAQTNVGIGVVFGAGIVALLGFWGFTLAYIRAKKDEQNPVPRPRRR